MPVVKCSVCKTCDVDTASTEFTAEHELTVYYFCGDNCEAKFLEHPHSYLGRHSH